MADREAVARDIVPIRVTGADGTVRIVQLDEGLRPGTSAEKLGSLRCAFESPEASTRFPEIRWSVTAG